MRGLMAVTKQGSDTPRNGMCEAASVAEPIQGFGGTVSLLKGVEGRSPRHFFDFAFLKRLEIVFHGRFLDKVLPVFMKKCM